MATIAYVWFYLWTSEQSTRPLREEARTKPESLFPVPPRIGSARNVRGRDDLIGDLATTLHRRYEAGPQVIVGDTGTGKTSLLLGLSWRLARDHDRLPIVVSLRGRDSIDFVQLAKDRFKELVDPYIRTDADGEKLWRWMWQHGRIAVLADDLDRARVEGVGPDPDASKAATWAAIETARRRKLPLVVTSRPSGVPDDLPERPIELPQLELSLDEAQAYVFERTGKRPKGETVELAQAYIRRGRLLDNAFYLNLLGELAAQDRLPPLPAEGAHEGVRLALLAAWRTSLLGDGVPLIEERARRQMLERLELYAARSLAPRDDQSSQTAWLNDLRAGQRLGLVEVTEDGTYGFIHDVVHAYFAARVLASNRRGWRHEISFQPNAARVQLALVMAATESQDVPFSREVCHALLEVPESEAHEQRLLRAIAAAEVTRAGAPWAHDLADRIARECVAAMPESTPIARRAAIDHLAGLGGSGAIEAMWEYATDADYGVRWAAMRGLVQRCSQGRADVPEAGLAQAGVRVEPSGVEAYTQVLAEQIEGGLETARRCLEPGRKRPDDWDDEILPLKNMAWMLPALTTEAARSGDGAYSDLVGSHLSALLGLLREEVTKQRGLEASIAQGFKVAAQLHDRPVDPAAWTLLREGKFWYSRVNLLQAVTLALVATGVSTDAETAIKDYVEARDEHPYVRATAKFCLTALAKAKREGSPDRRLGAARQYIWDDEGVVVSRRPRELADPVIQLVGDMAVLLNLNETGSVAKREWFGTQDVLPHCMSRSKDRRELFEADRACPDDCRFDLCPFRPRPGRSARREISRAFCRHQRLYARARTTRRWQSKVRRRALREFWAELEALAKA